MSASIAATIKLHHAQSRRFMRQYREAMVIGDLQRAYEHIEQASMSAREAFLEFSGEYAKGVTVTKTPA